MPSIDEHFQHGQAYCNEGKYDLAIEEFTKAINLDPNNPNVGMIYGFRGIAYRLQGDIYQTKGDYDSTKKGYYGSAITDLDQVISLYPEALFAYRVRGIAHMRLGNHSLAFADFEKALKLDPNDIDTLFNRGLLYGSLNDLNRVITDMEVILRIDPNHKGARSLLEMTMKVLDGKDPYK